MRFTSRYPRGCSNSCLHFQFMTPVAGDWPRRVMTPALLELQWEKALLYPAGHYARQITFEPSVRLPSGWQFATALEGAHRTGDLVTFQSSSLERLVDSPLMSGPHYRRIELDSAAAAPVRLNIFADRAAELDANAAQIEAHRRLVQEELALFGSRHYAHYDFLLAISDQFSQIGLEHLESSENGVGTGLFHRLGGERAQSRPAGARNGAFVERQVPAPRRACEVLVRAARESGTALGLRGHDRLPGTRPRRAFGVVVERFCHGGAGALRREL